MYHISGSAEAMPLAQGAPLLAEALPNYAPVDSLTIRTDRLSAFAQRLGYAGMDLGAYEGAVTEEDAPRFMDAFAPREPGERPALSRSVTAEQRQSTQLAIPLNVPQIDVWALRHPSKLIRSPAAWKAPLNAAIRMAVVDEGRRQLPKELSYWKNLLLQTHLFLPIVGEQTERSTTAK